MASTPRYPDLSALFTVDAAKLTWRPLHDGVDVAVVLKDRARDFSVMFLRFAPGSRAVRHHHPDGEQFFVISGEIVDENGRYPAGTFANQPPGSTHEPESADGALVLVTWFGKLSGYGR